MRATKEPADREPLTLRAFGQKWKNLKASLRRYHFPSYYRDLKDKAVNLVTKFSFLLLPFLRARLLASLPAPLRCVVLLDVCL